MKSILFALSILTGFNAYALRPYVCHYAYEAEGQVYYSTIQKEEINGVPALSMRESTTGELIFAFAIDREYKNRLGQNLVDATLSFEDFGADLQVKLRLPLQFPGEGRFTYYDGDEVLSSEPVYCER